MNKVKTYCLHKLLHATWESVNEVACVISENARGAKSKDVDVIFEDSLVQEKVQALYDEIVAATNRFYKKS